jgi:short-subunit dehydrogenase
MDDNRPLALVTGASSGIGYELARQFAEHGYDLVINAEDARLELAAGRLRETGVAVRAVRADLRDPAEVDRLVAATTGLRLDVAALNAGVGQGGAFVDTDLADDQSVIDLNVTATVRLAKPLLREMVARDAGHLGCSPRPSRPPCRAPSSRSTTPPSPSCSPSPRVCRTS